jgi:hypothetical protein
MPASISQLADPSIYQTQTPAPKGMSLQELTELGRSTTALQREKALLPFAIEQGQALSKKAIIEADTAKLDNSLRNIGAIVQDQQMLLTKPDLTANDIIERAKASAKQFNTPQEALDQALAGIPMNGSASDLRAYLASNLAKTLGAQSQLEKMYPGGVLPGQLPAGGYQVSSGAAEGGTPKGVTADQMTQPVRSDFSKPVNLSYPVRQAGQAYTSLPQEEEERKVGTATKSVLFQRQSELPIAKRTINEVIKTAKELEKEEWAQGAGILGKAGRNLSTFLGTEQGIRYKELSKDLANAQIENIKAGGPSLGTDAGKNLAGMASGDITYPPKVLMEIARRTQADMDFLDSKATAIKKFSDKFGDANISAFNQMWAANADPDIFKLKNIFEDTKMSDKEKAKARDEILGTDKKKIQIFNEKWNNIKKLEQTGSL